MDPPGPRSGVSACAPPLPLSWLTIRVAEHWEQAPYLHRKRTGLNSPPGNEEGNYSARNRTVFAPLIFTWGVRASSRSALRRQEEPGALGLLGTEPVRPRTGRACRGTPGPAPGGQSGCGRPWGRVPAHGTALSPAGASRGRGTPRSAPSSAELPKAGRGLLHQVLQPVFNTCQLLYKWHL